MSNVKNTNQFFNKAYKNLSTFATSPYTGWKYPSGTRSIYEEADSEIKLKALLTPVLLPLTVFTTAVSLVLAAVTAFIHLLALAGSACIDTVANVSDVVAMNDVVANGINFQ